MSAPTERLRWRHHAACPGMAAHLWIETPVLAWEIDGEVIQLLRCGACGSHVARGSLWPEYSTEVE